MQNYSDLGHFKRKIMQKSITFEQKLWFSKFKGLNRSEFHQSTNYRYKSVRFLKKYRFRYEIPKIGTSEGPTPLSPTSTSPLIVFLASSLNPNISFFLPLKSNMVIKAFTKSYWIFIRPILDFYQSTLNFYHLTLNFYFLKKNTNWKILPINTEFLQKTNEFLPM